MSPRSRSRSASSQRSYGRSPDRRTRRRHRHYSRSVSRCRNPPSPPPLPPTKHDSRQPNGSRRRSLSRSPPSPPRYSRRQLNRRRESRSGSRSRKRSRSRTPYDKHNRERPSPSRCLGVFGLSDRTTQYQIREIFSKYGPIERIQVVTDAQTRRSRGFCFIYYENIEDAGRARDNCCGLEIDGRRIRVAYSITHRAHTPTPGVYRGQPAKLLRERHHREQRRHSPASPPINGNSRGRYERGRSRSRSPRRYR